MNEKIYASIRKWFLTKEYRFKSLKFLYNILPIVVFLTYLTMMVYLVVNRDIRLVKFMAIPFVLFVAVSIFRKFENSPRPYTVLQIEPLIKRDKIGESFPSRHVLSVSVIAVACMYINTYIGIGMCVVAILIAVIRVVSGVHFIKDVVCGALIGIMIGGFAFIMF